MSGICPTCGLPEEVCACKDIVREREDVRVFTEGRSHNKTVTIIGGLDGEKEDLEELASELKKSFGCGGTVKNGHVELQGDHRERVKEALIGRGFPREAIEIS